MGVGHRPNTSHPRTGMLKEERHKGSCAAMAAARAQTDIHHPPPVPINQSISRPIDQPIGLPVAPISQSISQSTTQSPSMGKGAARAVRAVLPHRQARGPPSANRTQSAPVPASQPPSYVGLRREQSAHYAPSAHMHPTREPYAPSDYLQPSILHLHASSHVHPSHAHRAIEDDIPVPSARGALYQARHQMDGMGADRHWDGRDDVGADSDWDGAPFDGAVGESSPGWVSLHRATSRGVPSQGWTDGYRDERYRDDDLYRADQTYHDDHPYHAGLYPDVECPDAYEGAQHYRVARPRASTVAAPPDYRHQQPRRGYESLDALSHSY